MKRILLKLNMRWTTVKGWPKNKVIQVSYVIVALLPIVLDIIKKNGGNVNIPASVYQVFYSSITLLLLYILYGISAPSEIKQYSGLDSFVEQRNKTLAEKYPLNKLEIVMTQLDESENEVKQTIENLIRNIDEEQDTAVKNQLKERLDSIVNQLYPGKVKVFLEKKWRLIDTAQDKDYHKSIYLLLACYTLFLIATILLVPVFMHRIATVINY